MNKDTREGLIDEAIKLFEERADVSSQITFAAFCRAVDFAIQKSFHAGLQRAGEVVEKRIKYIGEFRSEIEKFGDPNYDFRSGWSGVESGDCCDKCVMREEHMTGRADALKSLVGCRNPFQMKEICECHIPSRKFAAKIERKTLSDLLSALKRQREGIEKRVRELLVWKLQDDKERKYYNETLSDIIELIKKQ